MPKRKGEGRDLTAAEVALLKGMDALSYSRDYILSFFIRPGRVISPAAVSDVRSGRIGESIEAASERDVREFISQRMTEVGMTLDVESRPASELRVRQVLRTQQEIDSTLPGFENHFVEFKERLPVDVASRAKIAKSLASFANHRGGYVIFGVRDDRSICGVESEAAIRALDILANLISEKFSPFFELDRGVIQARASTLAVMYAFEASEKPIIASADYGEIKKSSIYYR